jgi:uncharacterized membrane protein
MTDRITHLLILVAALGAGLIAGVFFAFSSFVMGALGKLPPAQGLAAMQSINIVVINPLFMAVFLGTGLLAAYLAVWAGTHWSEPRALWVMLGALAYVVGSVGVTLVFNVPLNDALAAADPASTDGAALWARYQGSWALWNHVRGLASLAAMALLVVAYAS